MLVFRICIFPYAQLDSTGHPGGFETLGAETDKRQSQRLEALHHGGLWGCPLVYSTTIAPYQRATSRASMSRALWHNAEMQDGVKHFLATAHSQLSLGTFHHGGLWGCPLLYSTTIAPSQRATWRASMSRARWHNAEMQDGVKCFLGFLQCVRNCHWYTSPW